MSPSSASSVKELISRKDHLPPLPSTLPFLLQTLSDNDVSYEDLAEAITKFPNVAARLLSVANSAWSSPRSPITSLDRACAQLGLVLTRSISISLAVSAPFNVMKCPPFKPELFWFSAFLVADGAYWLGSQRSDLTDVPPKALHTAGLLHNLGLLWLADSMPGELARAIELASGDETLSIDAALRSVVGIGMGEVGGLLAHAWRLPEFLANSMEHHDNVGYDGDQWQAVRLIGVSAGMLSALRRDRDCPERVERAGALDISMTDYGAIFEKMRQKSTQTRELAAALCGSP